ncbi:MAG: ABC transporter permease [Isosphaeraceae bacterium]
MKSTTDETPPPHPASLPTSDASPSRTNRNGESVTDRAEEEFPELVIQPSRGWIGINWHELFQFRELLYFLAWRDIKIRYKQTVLGLAWALLQPLVSMIVFSVVFGRFGKIPSENAPYPVYVLAGLIPWTLFASGVTAAAQSLIQQQAMLSKIYFPRLFLPTATIGPFFVDAMLSFVLYGIVLAIYGIVPSWQVIFLPLLIVFNVVATLGMGYLLAALILRYRDFRHVLPFVIQIMMFASPVIYPVWMLGRHRWMLMLNPMSGLIQGYRSAILGTPWDPPGILASVVMASVMFVVGLFYFRRTERVFADIA